MTLAHLAPFALTALCFMGPRSRVCAGDPVVLGHPGVHRIASAAPDTAPPSPAPAPPTVTLTPHGRLLDPWGAPPPEPSRHPSW